MDTNQFALQCKLKITGNDKLPCFQQNTKYIYNFLSYMNEYTFMKSSKKKRKNKFHFPLYLVLLFCQMFVSSSIFLFVAYSFLQSGFCYHVHSLLSCLLQQVSLLYLLHLVRFHLSENSLQSFLSVLCYFL